MQNEIKRRTSSDREDQLNAEDSARSVKSLPRWPIASVCAIMHRHACRSTSALETRIRPDGESLQMLSSRQQSGGLDEAYMYWEEQTESVVGHTKSLKVVGKGGMVIKRQMVRGIDQRASESAHMLSLPRMWLQTYLYSIIRMAYHRTFCSASGQFVP